MKKFSILILCVAVLAAIAPAQTQDSEIVALTIDINEFVELILSSNEYLIEPILPLQGQWHNYPPVDISGIFVVENGANVNIYTSISRIPTDDVTLNTLDTTDNFSLQMTGDFNASPVALTLIPELYTTFVGTQSPAGTYFLNMRSQPSFPVGHYTTNLTITAIVE